MYNKPMVILAILKNSRAADQRSMIGYGEPLLQAERQPGREALAQARNVGLAGQPGTLGHRFVASLIGLQRKTRLAALLRAIA